MGGFGFRCLVVWVGGLLFGCGLLATGLLVGWITCDTGCVLFICIRYFALLLWIVWWVLVLNDWVGFAACGLGFVCLIYVVCWFACR